MRPPVVNRLRENLAYFGNGMKHAGPYPNASAHHVSPVAPAPNTGLATAVPTVVVATEVPPAPAAVTTTVPAKNQPVRALNFSPKYSAPPAVSTAVLLPFAPAAHLGLPAPMHFG